MKKNLYALLVGINQYPFMPPERQLNGCLNDVAAVEKYLYAPFVQAAFQKVYVRKMVSPGEALPTKNNVVQAFREFLGQAGPEDSIWFYFSGHGVREQTNIPAFQKSEIDGNIAGLAMRDFNGAASSVGKEMLADKEIRYLMRELTHRKDGSKTPHILMMIDCCHSGESTRSVAKPAAPHAASRQIERYAFPARAKEDFIFWQDAAVQTALENEQDVETVLPEAPHVMLGACLPIELCWENAGADGGEPLRGVFNRHVLSILTEQQGRVSYDTLYRRVLNRIRFQRNPMMLLDDDRQTPQLYVQSSGDNHRQRQVLTNTALDGEQVFPVDYSSTDREWRLGAGVLHGMTVNTEIKVEHASKPGQQWKAMVKSLYPDRSLLEWPQGAPPSDLSNYQAKLSGMGFQPLSFFIKGEAATQVQDLIEKKIAATGSKVLNIVTDEEAAHYVLHAKKEQIVLSLPHDEENPLLEPYYWSAESEASLKEVVEECTQIARWHFLRDLEHRAPGLDKPVIELRVFEKTGEGQERQIFLNGQELHIALSQEKPSTLLRFELVNQSDQSYHCSLIYMSPTFGFLANDKGLMERPILLLERGHALKSRPTVKNGPYFSFSLGDHILQNGWPEEKGYLKLIYSKTPYDIEQFNMASLKAPGKARETERFGKPAAPAAPPQAPEWEIRTYGFSLMWDV
jgi:hypothetical protein